MVAMYFEKEETMPKTVHVVMGNDFPECVYKTEESAEKFIKGEKAKDAKASRRIHWRQYAFEVRE